MIRTSLASARNRSSIFDPTNVNSCPRCASWEANSHRYPSNPPREIN